MVYIAVLEWSVILGVLLSWAIEFVSKQAHVSSKLITCLLTGTFVAMPVSPFRCELFHDSVYGFPLLLV
jgi:hypothetical protein